MPPALPMAPSRMRSGSQSRRAAADSHWPPCAPSSAAFDDLATTGSGDRSAALVGDAGCRRTAMTVAAAMAANPAGQSATRRYRRIQFSLSVYAITNVRSGRARPGKPPRGLVVLKLLLTCYLRRHLGRGRRICPRLSLDPSAPPVREADDR